MKIFQSLGIVFIVLLGVNGCGLVRDHSAPIRTYHLELPDDVLGKPVQISSPRENKPTLLVSIPEPGPGFESSRMVYVQVPHEMQAFASSQWVDSPARMLTPLLVRSLEQSGLWQSVTAMPTVIRGDYRLDLTQVVLVQEFFQPPSRMRLAWRGQLLHLKDRRVKGTRMFVREEEAVSEDAYGGVVAAQQALAHLFRDLQEWLGKCLQGDSSAHC